MSKPLGPIEIRCDAPPYPVVKAGHRIGLQCPEDVRWWRMRHFLEEAGGRGLSAWKTLLGIGSGGKSTCTCGEALPRLERYTFTFLTGRQASYLIAQCARCHTVFWDEA